MAVIDIPDKICSHCGGNKWRVQIQGKYTSYFCYLKEAEYRKIYRKTNSFKINEDLKSRYKKSERYILSQERKAAYLNTINKVCKECNKVTSIDKFKKLSKYSSDAVCNSCKNKKLRIKQQNELRDCYVKRCIKQNLHLNNSDIPQDLVELKRKQLILIRQLRKL